MTHFPKRIALLLALSIFLLPSCAWMSPPKPYLPARAGLEPGESVTVKDNENIYTIAREHNVSMRDMIVLNNLKPPFDVRPGQSLTLPAGTSTSFAGDMPVPQAAPLGAVEKNELAPIEPSSVSSEALEPVAPAPQTPPPASSGSGRQAAMALTPPQETKAATAPAASTQAEPVPALNRPSPPQQQVATTATTAATASDSTDASGAALGAKSDMVWPVQGPILQAFGSKGAGLNNDGVNIGAPKGAPVVAAASGTVVYAGNEMRGFGNLVLIRHQGDWVTAYAHLDRVLVKKDSIVGQGDEIGTVGKTGNVGAPQLHFETRHGGKPVDPAGVIKGGM